MVTGDKMSGIMNEEIKKKIEIFEEAFRASSVSCRERCECGQQFYDGSDNSWDWNEGELEELQTNATCLNYGVELVNIEGGYYVRDCHCWHSRAIQIMHFLDAFDTKIAEYFKLEKSRKEDEAKRAVTINILYNEMKDGWREMGSAPRDATTLEVLMHNRTTKHAHWAQDLSGEEQPIFRGWFDENRYQIEDPIAWRYINIESKN